MNYLGLTNAFITESGVTNVVSTLEESVEDDVLQAAHWVNKAWVEFQVQRRWPFRWTEGSFTVSNGTTAYSADTLGIGAGSIIVPDSFYTAEGRVYQAPYVDIRAKRRASTSVDTSRVLEVAVRNNSSMETYPDIATSQVVYFDYWRAATELVLNTDVPTGFPADFHMLIVHSALFKYGADIGGQDGANTYAAHGGLYAMLRNNYLNTL